MAVRLPLLRCVRRAANVYQYFKSLLTFQTVSLFTCQERPPYTDAAWLMMCLNLIKSHYKLIIYQLKRAFNKSGLSNVIA